MAILENGTENYFKIDLANSFVQKNMVFAAITVYCTETDRQNEKRRLGEFLLFDTNCKRKLQELCENEQFADIYESFSKAVGIINDRKYITGGLELPQITFSQEIMRLLTECGYQPEWINQPIRIVSKKFVNCGKCEEESLSAEYIYAKLKTKMSPDIRDI